MIEQRLAGLETRVAEGLKIAAERPVAAVRRELSSVGDRLKQELRAAVKDRLVAGERQLENVRIRVVEELGKELRRVTLILFLGATAALLGLLGGFLALLGTWLSLRRSLGAEGTSFLLAGLFVLLSAGALRALHSVTARAGSQPPPSARNTAS